jgi:hypothetical protein
VRLRENCCVTGDVSLHACSKLPLSAGCVAHLAREAIKHLLYLRCQVPQPYDTLCSNLASIDENTRTSAQKRTAKYTRGIEQLLDSIEPDLFTSNDATSHTEFHRQVLSI